MVEGSKKTKKNYVVNLLRQPSFWIYLLPFLVGVVTSMVLTHMYIVDESKEIYKKIGIYFAFFLLGAGGGLSVGGFVDALRYKILVNKP